MLFFYLYTMPELPEVQTQVTQLAQILIGRSFTDLQTDTPKLFQGGLQNFHTNLLHKKIQKVTRRGKYILIHLETNLVLVIHFRMTGHFLLQTEAHQYQNEKSIRAIFSLDNSHQLLYQDIRKFGRFWLGTHPQIFDQAGITNLGPEPLDLSFTLAKFKKNIQKHKTQIKPLLLNQKFIAGIGNIYADESLFLARIHPLHPAHTLTPTEIKNLHQAIRQSLRSGIRHGGTTVGEYVGLHNEKGTNQNYLHAYRRHNQPCTICGHPMQRIIVAQRGTTICPHCQKIPK